jgi:hypothetical protein
VEASAAPFYSKTRSNYYSIVNLRNTNKGYTYAFSASLAKSFDFGLDMSASYTFGRSKSVNDGTSSVAYSNWKYNYSRDTNSENELGFSKFDVPHRLMAQLSSTSISISSRTNLTQAIKTSHISNPNITTASSEKYFISCAFAGVLDILSSQKSAL